MCKAIYLTNYLKERQITRRVLYWYVWGRHMSEFIWHWTRGSSKIYTRKTEVAEEAMKDGMLVMGVRVKPRILKY